MTIDKRILYEDNHLIAVNKLPGELSQGDSSDRTFLNHLLKSYIKKKYQKPGNVFLGVVHRLDYPVSGVIVYAKTSKSASRLSEQIRKHQFTKVYSALSIIRNRGALVTEWTRVENQLVRTHDKTRSITIENTESKKGVLYYKTIAKSEKYALNLVKLETGRKHQIRCQLSERGLPIAGDVKYGGDAISIPNSICLHSSYISLFHPTKKSSIILNAPLPAYFSQFITIPSDIGFVE